MRIFLVTIAVLCLINCGFGQAGGIKVDRTASPIIHTFAGDLIITGDLAVTGAQAFHGGMYYNANGDATTIETSGTPIAMRSMTVGELSGFTFDAGQTGSITEYYERGANVGAKSASHGLTSNDYISIRGTTDYNGIFQITVVDADSFYFTDSWVNDNGASDWDEPSHLIVGTDGSYMINASLSASEGGGAGSTVTYAVYVNDTIQNTSRIQRKFANNDVGAFSMHGILNVSAGDWIFVTANSSGTNAVTHSYGTIIIEQL